MDPQTAQQTPAPVSVPPAAQSMPTTPVEATIPVPVSPAPPAASPTTPAAPQPEAKKSSNMMWIIMIVMIVAILAVAGWFLYQYSMNKPSDSMTTVYPAQVPSPTIGSVKSGDQQLDEQSDAIDANMEKLDNDVKGVDSGLNDKIIDLSQ